MSHKDRILTSSKVDGFLKNHPYRLKGDGIGTESLLSGLEMLDRMVTEGIIEGTSGPSKKQRDVGIDWFCYVVHEGERVKIPIRITSSVRKVQELRERYGWDSLILTANRRDYEEFCRATTGQIEAYLSQRREI